MSDFDRVDYYTDLSLVDDPYPYFEYLRGKSPVQRLPHHNVVAVTGYEEALAVFGDSETFSSINAVTGPLPLLPFVPEGNDISAQLEQFRPQMPMTGRIVTLDRPVHAPARSLLTSLFTPSRLRENEAYIWGLADSLIDGFADNGQVELVRGYGVPFAGLVIADLLGVPEEDRESFKDQFGGLPSVGEGGKPVQHNPFAFIEGQFIDYIEDRRRAPRKDVLSDLATAKYPDGSTPTVKEVVSVATFLFGAGQDTTARLLGFVMQTIAERPDLQDQLRADRSLIPDFIEEALRMDGPVKTSHRLVRKSTRLGGVDLPAGTTVALLNGAMNRDPRRFDAPSEFRLGRPKAREHLGFGRGAHTCIGSPLARTETRISVERLLDRLGDIRISDEKHGPAGARRFSHEPTYILRGLQALHLEFTPVSAKKSM